MRIGGIVLVVVAAGLIGAGRAGAAALSPESQRQFDRVVKPFLETHCYKCHNDQKTRAGFRIDTLGTDFLVDKTADNWKEIYDNLGLGKMPPKKELVRPTEADARAVTDWIDQEIRNAARLARNSNARTRRLNRTEYFNTLRDLFHLDEGYVRTLADELPPDAKVDGFDRVGTSLYIDQSQLAKYFDLADRVLTDQVFLPKPKPTTPARDFAKDITWPRESERGSVSKLTAMAPFAEIYLGANPFNHTLARLPTGATVFEMKNGGIEYLAGGRASPIGSHGDWSVSGAGGGTWTHQVGNFFFRLNQEGKYRMKIRAGAFAGAGKHALENVKLLFEYGKNGESVNLDRASVVIDAPLDHPKEYVIDVYLHPHPEIAGGSRGTLMWNGLPASDNHKIVNGMQTQTGTIFWAPELWDYEQQCIRDHYFLASGEAKKGTPRDKINELLKSRFAGVNKRHDEVVAAYIGAKKPVFVYNPEFNLAEIPRLHIESWEIDGPIVDWPPVARTELLFAGEDRSIDSSYIREILARFLPRAYRRAVDADEVNNWVQWVVKTQADFNLSGIDAVKEGVKAILCSPDFLLLDETAGDARARKPLTDYELASRLSYFLWSTMPDEELAKLAASNQLHEPKTLQAQVKRMIADARCVGLIKDFTGQWLQVRDFNKTMTDRNQYRSYTDELQKSELQEPYEFFTEVLKKDLSIINFLDSNFVMIDKQLADLYGIEGVKDADGFKKVAITPEQHRGGVLGMAGVLTYLTDGFRTLPVRRAAYVKDVLWNEPAKPPPPNAGDLPAIKGKNLTVRERLEQHRNSPSCASCHAHLDPFGIALENYDALGKWRDRQNGEGMRGDDKSPLLDVSGTLPNGREFKDLAGYKQALLAEKDHFVRGFTMKVLTYALGRSVGATDRETVDAIVHAIEHDDYRMQSLVQAVVASEAFRMK